MSREQAPREATFERSPLRECDVIFRRNRLARRFIARVTPEGQVVITLPSRSSQKTALAFANLHLAWICEQQVRAHEALQAGSNSELRVGDPIWFRGEQVDLKLVRDWGRPAVRFHDQKLMIADPAMDLRRPLSDHLLQIAKAELPVAVDRFARRFALKVSKVVVRDQKSRWGSCSSKGVISLNWRLVLVPEKTRDYIIIHELMHLKELNHSPAFWRLVANACPNFREHERWLAEHQDSLIW